jgi:hypothetical protein
MIEGIETKKKPLIPASLVRVLVVAIPALATASGSYFKSKSESVNAYKVLAEQVSKQAEAIEVYRKDSLEWRKLMVDTVLRLPVAPPAVVRPPRQADDGGGYAGGSGGHAAPSPRAALQALGNRAAPMVRLKQLPMDFQGAQQRANAAY